MKVVYHAGYGYYKLSESVLNYLREKGLLTTDEWDEYQLIPRHNKVLVEAVELFKDDNPEIFIQEIEGNGYYIRDYDGAEDVIYCGHDEWINVNDDE